MEPDSETRRLQETIRAGAFFLKPIGRKSIFAHLRGTKMMKLPKTSSHVRLLRSFRRSAAASDSSARPNEAGGAVPVLEDEIQAWAAL